MEQTQSNYRSVFISVQCDDMRLCFQSSEKWTWKRNERIKLASFMYGMLACPCWGSAARAAGYGTISGNSISMVHCWHWELFFLSQNGKSVKEPKFSKLTFADAGLYLCEVTMVDIARRQSFELVVEGTVGRSTQAVIRTQTSAPSESKSAAVHLIKMPCMSALQLHAAHKSVVCWQTLTFH